MGLLSKILGGLTGQKEGEQSNGGILSKLIPAGLSAAGSILTNRAGSKSTSSGTGSRSDSSTSVSSGELGKEGQDIFKQLQPQLQGFQQGSVDPSSVDAGTDAQFRQASAGRDSLIAELTGQQQGSGLGFSAGVNQAKGIAEGAYGGTINDITAQNASDKRDVARGNREEQIQGASFGSQLLSLLPQQRTQTNVGESSTQSQGQQNTGGGSTIGNILQTAGDAFSFLRGQNKPERFQPTGSPGISPSSTKLSDLGAPPQLADSQLGAAPTPTQLPSQVLPSLSKPKKPLTTTAFGGQR